MNLSENTLLKLELKAARQAKAQKRANELRAKLHAQDGPRETWKQIAEFPNYEVSDAGRVRTRPHIRSFIEWFAVIKTRMRGQRNNKHGYPCVTFFYDDRTFCKTVHRLVAHAFIPNPSRLPDVNHINGIKCDNRPANLEWCNQQYNMRHRARVLLINIGEDAYNHKLTESDIIRIRSMRQQGRKLKAIAELFSVSISLVWNVCNGVSWKHIK